MQVCGRAENGGETGLCEEKEAVITSSLALVLVLVDLCMVVIDLRLFPVELSILY